MQMVTRAIPVLVALVLAAAPLAGQRRSTVLTVEDIERAEGRVRTAYDAVESLRPRWLQMRDATMQGGSEIRVYMDDVDQGGVDYLKTIPAERVLQLRWYSINEAGSRFGPVAGPVIVVTLKRNVP